MEPETSAAAAEAAADEHEQVVEETKTSEASLPSADDVATNTADDTTTDITTTPAAEPLPLDWTQLGVKADEAMPLRFPHDVAEILPTDLDICIVGTAGQKITQIPKDFSSQQKQSDNTVNPDLETLVLRSHLITKMQGLEGFTKLELLELYDNQVQALESLEGPGPNLRVLDMSYNSIKDMTPVSLCVNLKELCKLNDMDCIVVGCHFTACYCS